MTALEEFYEAYLHYSVSQRLFEDRCRQLTESDGTVSERQALVDETLRLAMCVTNNVIDLEPLLSEAADELRNGGGDRDILKALSLVSNTIREDRDRADSYTLFVTARRSGNTVRRPRRPRVANPFKFVEEDYEETGEDPVEEEETVVVTPTPKPARIRVKPKHPAPIIVPEDPVEEEETTGESEEETQEEELVEEDPVEDESEDVIEEEEPEEETREEELVEEDPVEEEETAPVVGPVPPAPNEGAEEDPVEEEEDKEESPVVTPAPARAKPKRPAPVVVPEDPVKDEETEEEEEEPAHPAALDRPRPKRKFKPRTEEPPEEDFIEDPDVPKRGLGSRLHNIVTALTSHIPRRK